MKNGNASIKVSGGKLVRIDVSWSNKIENIKITGDFFLHPEEIITEIENVFIGQALHFDQKEMSRLIDALLHQHQAQLIGASSDILVTTLMEALKCNSE